MSGGHFDYKQYELGHIADEIEQLIRNNSKEPTYSDETIVAFFATVGLLKFAEVFVHRIDWLVSGDDGEDSFHRRLKAMLETAQDEIDKLRAELAGKSAEQS